MCSNRERVGASSTPVLIVAVAGWPSGAAAAAAAGATVGEESAAAERRDDLDVRKERTESRSHSGVGMEAVAMTTRPSSEITTPTMKSAYTAAGGGQRVGMCG